MIATATTTAFYFLPLAFPPPEPAGYAPYAFHYSLSFLLPLSVATFIAFVVAALAATTYLHRTAEIADPRRKSRLVVLSLLALPIGADAAWFAVLTLTS